MTFEYRDAYGRVLTADHGLDDDNNPMAVLWSRGEYGVSVPVRIPAARVEEVIAGIRDAARTASGHQPETHPGYDIAGYPEPHAGPREKCPDPACETDQHANCGAECPAVGQPAEPTPWRCAYCGLEVEDRGHPLIQKHSNWYPRWVHADWGGEFCHPQKGSASTRAMPAVGQPAEAQATDAAPLTSDERKFLHFALDLAFGALVSGDGFTNEDDAVCAKLRRLAGKDER